MLDMLGVRADVGQAYVTGRLVCTYEEALSGRWVSSLQREDRCDAEEEELRSCQVPENSFVVRTP